MNDIFREAERQGSAEDALIDDAFPEIVIEEATRNGHVIITVKDDEVAQVIAAYSPQGFEVPLWKVRVILEAQGISSDKLARCAEAYLDAIA